jgi:ELWxxDGT repeat protein
VKEVSSGTQSANPGDLTVVGTRAFFWADDGGHGFEPWTTDGTTDGTVAVADIEVGVRVSSFPSSFTPIGGVTYFAAGGAGDRELWKVDDASLVASRVKDVNPSGSAFPSQLANVGGTLFFAASDGCDRRGALEE